MIARLRKSLDEKEQGFTLIELLVVIIIIGILASIAIPLFLNQRKKAVDTAARSDVTTLGKEVAAYYTDNSVAPSISMDANGNYVVDGSIAGRASEHITYGNQTGDSNLNWCVFVNIAADKGTLSTVSYSAERGLENDENCS